jgi:hypothetical protein
MDHGEMASDYRPDPGVRSKLASNNDAAPIIIIINVLVVDVLFGGHVCQQAHEG